MEWCPMWLAFKVPSSMAAKIASTIEEQADQRQNYGKETYLSLPEHKQERAKMMREERGGPRNTLKLKSPSTMSQRYIPPQ